MQNSELISKTTIQVATWIQNHLDDKAKAIGSFLKAVQAADNEEDRQHTYRDLMRGIKSFLDREYVSLCRKLNAKGEFEPWISILQNVLNSVDRKEIARTLLGE